MTGKTRQRYFFFIRGKNCSFRFSYLGLVGMSGVTNNLMGFIAWLKRW